jgi:hypothetical protein
LRRSISLMLVRVEAMLSLRASQLPGPAAPRDKKTLQLPRCDTNIADTHGRIFRDKRALPDLPDRLAARLCQLGIE